MPARDPLVTRLRRRAAVAASPETADLLTEAADALEIDLPAPCPDCEGAGGGCPLCAGHGRVMRSLRELVLRVRRERAAESTPPRRAPGSPDPCHD